MLPALQCAGDNLAGRRDAVRNALVRGDDRCAALLVIFEQKMRGETAVEILEEEVLHVKENTVELSQDGTEHRVLNEEIRMQKYFHHHNLNNLELNYWNC